MVCSGALYSVGAINRDDASELKKDDVEKTHWHTCRVILLLPQQLEKHCWERSSLTRYLSAHWFGDLPEERTCADNLKTPKELKDIIASVLSHFPSQMADKPITDSMTVCLLG